MEDELEINIFLQTEEGKKYILEVHKKISFVDLKEKIKKLIFKNNFFYFVHNSKVYDDEESKDDLLNLEQGDTIYTFKTMIKEKYMVHFHQHQNLKEDDMKIVELSRILKICLLEYIANNIDNIERIKNKEIRSIISDLKNEMNLTSNPQEDIKYNLSQKFGSNIITFKYYIQELVTQNEINNLIGLFDKNKQKEIKAYWSVLSKYEEFNKLFEKEFQEAIENSYFDYSLS